MSERHRVCSHPPSLQRPGKKAAVFLGLTLVLSGAALAQQAVATLPEDPGAGLASSSSGEAASASQTPTAKQSVPAQDAPPQETRIRDAPIFAKHIPAGRGAEPLTVGEKIELTLRSTYSAYAFTSILVLSGYSHVLNGEPNYGTDSGAFGERLGATAIRSTTGTVFSGALFAPLLHQDPRYYVEGPSHNFFQRTLYAATRPFIARNDNGQPTLNGSLLLGYGAASILSYTYYPQINKNPHDTLATFGDSLAGAAVSYFVSEFQEDVLQALHLHRR